MRSLVFRRALSVFAALAIGALAVTVAVTPIPARQQIAAAMFWVSFLLLLYVVIGYPILIAVCAALRQRQVQREPLQPTVTIVIAAHNEARLIREKIGNLLSLTYPADRLEVLVGSDGSTDGTLELLRGIADPRLRVVDFPDRQGKAAILNALVPQASGEVVVLSDVRQVFDSDVLGFLTAPFADPTIGAVSGELILRRNANVEAVGEGVGLYWRYEKFIRSRESIIDSTIGATGAVYAIRKALFEAIPSDTILDDVLIPMTLTRRGYRVLFEPRARAFDLLPRTAREEFTRKARTLAGNFQLFARERWLLNPWRNRLWWQTVSHKVLRLWIPILQLNLLAASVALADESIIGQLALLVQTVFYSGAVAGWALQNSDKASWIVTFPFTFCLLSWATVVGFLRCVARRHSVTWNKAATE